MACHLHHQCRIFGEEYLYQVFFRHSVEVEVHTAFGVGKCHFQDGGEQPAGTHIVCGEQLLGGNQFLHGIECVGKIVGTLHLGSFVAHSAQGLGKG